MNLDVSFILLGDGISEIWFFEIIFKTKIYETEGTTFKILKIIILASVPEIGTYSWAGSCKTE